ncbi:MAG TPA: carbohydrate porin [Stellaceae bacterium]|nr:carbohydrate porin [Stellaceae bacterium]
MAAALCVALARLGLGFCLATLLGPDPARAQAQASEEPSGFWTRDTLLDDVGGLRSALDKVGGTLNLQEMSEVLGNVTGGIHRGATYDGLTTMSLRLDTDKAFHWPGGTFNVSALQIHGRSLSANNLANLQTVSGIEADRATRLWELWYQQALPSGKAEVKIGQQSIDQEFIVSQYAGLYLNTMMGWPMLPSADLYAGGPAYPLSSLGIRLETQWDGPLKLLGGVFDDNPPGGPFANDPQGRDGEASGTRFNLGTGALFIGELQYAVNPAAAADKSCDASSCALPGTYKLGIWYDTANFPDQRFDSTGLSLANPASSGMARQHNGNFSVYGVVDQMIWREPGGPRSLGVFGRIMGAPADRNLIDMSLNAGVNLKAPLPGRDDDTFGIGYGLAKVSGRAGALDQDRAAFTGTAYPVRSAEHFIEVTYQYQATPWWQVQPDFQYVINPGGGIQNPQNTTQRVGDEAVFGVRMNIVF